MDNLANDGFSLERKVIQPHLPIRLPCYDFTPVTNLTVVSALPRLGYLLLVKPTPHGVTGGVYKTGNVFTAAC